MSAADVTDLKASYRNHRPVIDTGFRKFWWISWISIFRPTPSVPVSLKAELSRPVGRRVRYNGPSSIGVMQASGPPSRAPVNDGPLNCRPYLVVKRRRRAGRRSGDWPVVNLSVYQSQKVRLFISFITLFPDPGTGRRGQKAGTITPGQGRRDNITKLPGQTSYLNSHSRMPGQRVGRHTRWDMTSDFTWPHTR